MYYYTIEDFSTILVEHSVIPPEVNTLLGNLEAELKRQAAQEPQLPQQQQQQPIQLPRNVAPSHRSSSSQSVVRRHGKGSTKSSTQNVSAGDWEALRSFKPTKKTEAAEGSDKIVNDIRMTLNKITQKTYETLKTNVIQAVRECLELYPDETTMQKLSKQFFDIVVRDRFLTDIYVDLYLALIENFPAFEGQFDARVDVYRETMDQMKYADPEKDYDAYCNYVKVNDQRKAMTLFIIQLFKKDKIPATYMLELVLFMLNKTRENRDMPNKTNEVDEITENFYLVYLHCNVFLDTCDEWVAQVVPIIREFAEIQLGSFPSISSRALLKYQDIVEGMD